MTHDANNPQQERDAQLAAAYRAGAEEAPPPALDDAIRAAARRAVGARPQAAGAGPMRRWQMPLSMAAVLVLCVSLVAVMRDEGGALTEAPRADAPAQRAARVSEATPKIELAPATPASKSLGLKLPGLQPPSAADAIRLGDAGGRLGAKNEIGTEAKLRPEKNSVDRANAADVPAEGGTLREKARKELAPAEPMAGARDRMVAEQRTANSPPASAEPERPAPASMRADSADRRIAAEAPARPAPAPAAPVANAVVGTLQAKTAAAGATAVQDSLAKQDADSVEALSQLPPAQWLARIEELRRQGRLDAARAGLAAFRKRYPDYALPAALRDWAQP